jgi:MFS family permease
LPQWETTVSSDRLADRLMASAYMAGFVAGLDATSAFFIFPSVRDDLANGDTASATWLLTIVGIVSAAVLLQAGRLADRFGYNKLLVVSALGATGAALLAATAPTLTLLVAAKGIQAGCLAALGVSSIAIIVRLTPPARLATALGTWAFWTATSGVVGPLLASVVVELGSWRYMFVVTAPITAVVAVLAWPGWQASFVQKKRSPVDVIGTLAAMAGLSLAVYALLEANDWGWLSGKTLASVAVSSVLLGMVIARSRGHVDPIVPLHLFSHRNFTLSVIIGFVASIMFFGMWLALLSYATDVWGQSLISTGFLLMLMPGTMSLFARKSGRYADANGVRGVAMGGALIFSAGFATVALTVGAEPSPALLLPAVFGGGIGMAAILSNITTVGTKTLEPALVGTGTAVMQTFHRIGGSLGSALVVAVLQTGEIGDPATHRRPFWMIAGLGIVVAALASTLTADKQPTMSETVDSATG